MQNKLTSIINKNRWANLPISHRGAIIIAIPAICLLGTIGAWIWSRQTNILLTKDINHTQNILYQTQKVVISLQDAESDLQNFYLTGNATFFDSFLQNKKNFPTILNELETLIKDQPKKVERLQAIKPLINQQLALFNQTTAATQALPQKTDIINNKKNFNQLRSHIASWQNSEQAFLNTQQATFEQTRQIVSIIQWSAAWISGLAYWAAVYLFTRLDQELHDHQIELQESNSFIQTITTNIVDGVITVKKVTNSANNSYKLKIETINPSCVEMFGYCPHDVIGKDIFLLLINPEASAEEKEQHIELLNSKIAQQEKERWQTQGYRKDKTHFPIEISISDMRHNNRFMVIIRDVTESEAAKSKLKARADELVYLSAILAKANADLEKQNQELDKFAYVASHDLKAPLRAIASLSEWIEEDISEKLSHENRYQMILLRGRVQRLSNLIDGLLEYSRIGRIKTVVETTDVASVIDEIIKKINPPPEFHIEVVSPMPVIITPKLLLQQVFLHLITNALKHHHQSSGRILISATQLKNFYEFAVTDDGPGIADEYHEKVFVIFQTLLARDIKESTGIGLAIVKKIVETLGGSIRLQSSEGSGSTFYFTWPIS